MGKHGGPTAARAETGAEVVAKAEWIRACVVGELGGFIPPAVTGAVLVWLDAPELLLVVGLIIAGTAEGVVLGLAQSRVISRILPDVSGWTKATATAAGIAWLAGMAGSSLVQAAGPIGLVIAVPGWTVGLLSMGFLQARRLAVVVDDAGRWVPVTTVAWLVGVSLPVTVLSFIPNGWPLVVHVVGAIAAAVAMGATVGAASAGTLFRIANR